ncbi:MAG: membrane protein insertase YidC, partial [Bacteroidales bacterium]|nr:membrane protein insertase YidC [Bacteroidales bacterium]
MDKNTVIGIVLIFLIFLGFSAYNNQRTGKFFRAETEYADSLYAAGDYDEAREAYIRALGYRPKDQTTISRVTELNSKLGLNQPVQQADTTVVGTGGIAAQPLSAQQPYTDTTAFGAFSGNVKGENEFFTIENDKIILTVASRGGRIYSVMLKEYKRYDSLPVILFNGDSTVFGYKFFTSDNKAIKTNDLFFKPKDYQGPIKVTDQPAVLTMSLMTQTGTAIEYLYTLHPGEYMVDFDTRFISLGAVVPQNTTSLAFDWKMYVPQQEKGRQNEETYTGLKYKVNQEGVEDLVVRQKKDVETSSLLRTDWIAYKDQFFSSVLIADDYFLNAFISSTKADPTSRYLRYFEAEIGVPYTPAEASTVSMKLYFGPNSFTLLKKYDVELEELVSLGRNIIRWINQYIIIPIFNFLDN